MLAQTKLMWLGSTFAYVKLWEIEPKVFHSVEYNCCVKDLSMKQDRLWVKGVHTYYVQHKDF